MTGPELIEALRDIKPSVEVVAGCYVFYVSPDVLHPKANEENIRAVLDDTNGDLNEAERRLNHQHIHDLVPWLEEPFFINDLPFLAEIYVALLEHELREKFPTVSFHIEVSDTEMLIANPLNFCVTFWAKRA